MFTSIRVRIFLFYMVLFTAVLLVFSIAIFEQLKTDMYSNMDEMLISRAEGIKGSIDAYREAEKLEYQKDGRPFLPINELDMSEFVSMAVKLLEEDEKYDPRLVKFDIELFDRDGASIAHSNALPYQINIPVQDKAEAILGNISFHDYVIEVNDRKKNDMRVFLRPVTEDGRVVYLVQISTSLSNLYTSLNRLRIALFVLLPLSLLAAGLIGIFLTSFVLRPVDLMINSARGMTGMDLKQRIHVPKTNDELQHLAEVFNELLGRLDTTVGAQRRLIQDITHELKTPITVIRGQIEVSSRRERSGSEYRKILSSTRDEMGRLGKIVENLLMLARFESMEIKLAKEEVDLYFIAAKTVKNLRVLAKKLGIRLSLSGESLLVCGDEMYLESLAVNMIENALKYTKSGGTVEVKTVKRGRFGVLSVKDNGIGIDKSDKAHIFDRFYRADKSRSAEGYGLGLSIVRSVAEAHGGTVSVKSQAGKGSEFVFSMPLNIKNK